MQIVLSPGTRSPSTCVIARYSTQIRQGRRVYAMLSTLFVRQAALDRHLKAPFLHEREVYLEHMRDIGPRNHSEEIDGRSKHVGARIDISSSKLCRTLIER